MIVDKKQIEKICNLAEEISKKIKSHLTEDEMRFFKGFMVFKFYGKYYEAVTINENGDIWVTGYTQAYENFVNRDIEYINNINDVLNRAQKAIDNAKEKYKESLGDGAIAIKELSEIKNNL